MCDGDWLIRLIVSILLLVSPFFLFWIALPKRRNHLVRSIVGLASGVGLVQIASVPLGNLAVFQTSLLEQGRTKGGIEWEKRKGYCRFGTQGVAWLVYTRAPGNWFFDLAFSSVNRPSVSLISEDLGVPLAILAGGLKRIRYDDRGALERTYRYTGGHEVLASLEPTRREGGHHVDEWDEYDKRAAAGGEAPAKNPFIDDLNPFIPQPEADERLNRQAAMLDTMSRVDRLEAADTSRMRIWQSKYGRGGLNLDENPFVSPEALVTPTAARKAHWGDKAWAGPRYTYDTSTGVMGSVAAPDPSAPAVDMSRDRAFERAINAYAPTIPGEMARRAGLSQSASTAAMDAASGAADFSRAAPYFNVGTGYDNPLGNKAQRDLYGAQWRDDAWIMGPLWFLALLIGALAPSFAQAILRAAILYTVTLGSLLTFAGSPELIVSPEFFGRVVAGILVGTVGYLLRLLGKRLSSRRPVKPELP